MINLAVVVPCYNEEDVLFETSDQLIQILTDLNARGIISTESFILFVDDGSRDKTWSLIEQGNASTHWIKGLKLSRNFGHQNALLAGLFNADAADVLISVDADLQDDLGAIEEMLLKYQEGYEIVYGVRDDRKTDSRFKRSTAVAFYKLLSKLGVETIYNHADYRLMSKRAIDTFKDFGEANLYLRGMVPLLGFKQTSVYYKRGKRFAGESKYPFKKMLSFAWSGISSMSIKPLHFVMVCGFSVFLLSIALTLYALIAYFLYNTAPGWASTVIPIYFLGGVQLLCIGLIGEYVAKIYKEVKGRPRFIIEKDLK